jgi:hypothetical protein
MVWASEQRHSDGPVCRLKRRIFYYLTMTHVISTIHTAYPIRDGLVTLDKVDNLLREEVRALVVD